jgi:uncharacterized membrane protein
MESLLFEIFFFTAVLVLFLLVDLPYLSLISETYNNVIQSIQGSFINPKILGFVVTYLIIAFQFYYFYNKDMSLSSAFILGFTTYGIYDFTNYALFDKYPLSVAITDTLWGGILYSIVFSIIKIYN